MLKLAVDLAIIGLLVAVLVHAAFLQRRLTRLRSALAEASALLPALDAATARLAAATEGVSGRVQAGLETIDARIAGGRAVAAELGAATRTAQEALRRLERQRLRPAVMPREAAEPKGFAERAARREAALAAAEPPAPDAPPGAAACGPDLRVA